MQFRILTRWVCIQTVLEMTEAFVTWYIHSKTMWASELKACLCIDIHVCPVQSKTVPWSPEKMLAVEKVSVDRYQLGESCMVRLKSQTHIRDYCNSKLDACNMTSTSAFKEKLRYVAVDQTSL